MSILGNPRTCRPPFWGPFQQKWFTVRMLLANLLLSSQNRRPKPVSKAPRQRRFFFILTLQIFFGALNLPFHPPQWTIFFLKQISSHPPVRLSSSFYPFISSVYTLSPKKAPSQPPLFLSPLPQRISFFAPHHSFFFSKTTPR